MATAKIAFTIIIPTWNNLPYLQLCIHSLLRNSIGGHQIVVHVNEGNDGTREWLAQENIDYTSSTENVGICKAVNLAAEKAINKYIVYLNDDMYVLPNWDVALWKNIPRQQMKPFMLSGTMIEPKKTKNKCVIVADHGREIESFKETELIGANHQKDNWSGSSWPPVLVPKWLWEKVGGLSEEFSPGMYSDPDLSKKLWNEGCRHFQGVGDSLVYHFQCKSTGKVKKNKGRQQFINKWGVTARDFYKHCLKMGQPFVDPLPEPKHVNTWLMETKGRILRKKL